MASTAFQWVGCQLKSSDAMVDSTAGYAVYLRPCASRVLERHRAGCHARVASFLRERPHGSVDREVAADTILRPTLLYSWP